jgi:hypothetical protein
MSEQKDKYTPKAKISVTGIEDGNYSDKYTPKAKITVT